LDADYRADYGGNYSAKTAYSITQGTKPHKSRYLLGRGLVNLDSALATANPITAEKRS